LAITKVKKTFTGKYNKYNTNTNKIYIAPGILKRIGAQTHGKAREKGVILVAI